MEQTELTWLPKFDLHVHLDGSLRPETVVELAKSLPRRRQFPPERDVRKAVIPPQRCSLETYLRAFEITVTLLQTETALERVAYELCEDAARENVIYLEIRFAPSLHLREGLTPQRVVEAVLAGMRRAEEAHPIRTGLILCAMKQEPVEKAVEVARLAAQYVERGVVAIDLAGPERGYPPTLHRVAIESAQAAGLHITIHAGEGCCPKHIREALDLGAERIGHGVYLYQDEATEQRVMEQGIALEVCPTSNLQIAKIVTAYETHPFNRYLKKGIRVTLNTDNRLMSETTVTNELAHMIEAFSLSSEEVKTVLRNSAEAAFTTDTVRDELRHRVEEAF